MPDHPSVGACDELAPRPAPRFTAIEGGPDCPGCAHHREQNRKLSDLLVQEADALHGVREYLLELKAGRMVDEAAVGARLWPVLAGFDLAPRPCARCVERRMAEQRHADLLLGLAGLQRAAGA